MKGWFKWRHWLWLTAIIPAILIILMPGYRWMNLLAVLWVALLGLVDVKAHQLRHKQQLASTIFSNHKQWITVMNHHRHDWMNDLQVLFGYIRLGKHEQVAEYVERIKGKMLAESCISKLKEPHLVHYLFGFRSMPSSFHLEVGFEYENEHDVIQLDDEQSGELIIQILAAYRLYASKDTTEEQVLRLVFHKQQDGLHIRFNYNGSLNNEQLWAQKIEQQLNSHSAARLVGGLNAKQLVVQLTKA
ncbi:hypothetical protein J40TS1_25480 [Paenibacillus montaniterrae]|uniref:SpoOB alpha-helical domain-containing protein n=1 Tax=Paenibacillus montaniterrae TaxID=429341 RepID=A0A919YRA2_9BACL|nr:Spo0B domain-containing protein [Paenibacillus montaniterrae]GIP16906.1 hypothetical protein J40TS1_25480 [Paenibacillus montaniterrae]